MCVYLPVLLSIPVSLCVCGGAAWGSVPMKGPTAGTHEYFNILVSSHIAFCQATISPSATHNGEKERGRKAEGKLMSL